MSSPIKKIKSLIPYLPEKDAKLAEKFLANSDYEALKELTWSTAEKLQEYILRGELPDKYKDLDVDKITELSVECSEFYYTLFPEALETEEDFDDFDDLNEEF